MIGDSTVLATATPAAAATTTVHEGGGGGGSNSGEDDQRNIIRGDMDESERMSSYGTNRWPRQETLALLKIRSDMDAVFRDSTPKGPLWEEVSRKLAQLGYNRSAKKCREKFENVYKYHKRTKDGRIGKSEGKTYRFFDQLEALDHHHQHQYASHSTPPPPPQPLPLPPPRPPSAAVATPSSLPWTNQPTVPSTKNPTSIPPQTVVTLSTNPINATPLSSSQPIINHDPHITFPSFQSIPSHLFSSSTSSSTASDEELEGVSMGTRRKPKRKWKGFFERLTKSVMKKQEELQRRFLETVEKRERERAAREESWRVQEMSRINREHEVLIQERSTAAAKDAAVIALLQKISGQQYSLLLQDNDNNNSNNHHHPQQQPPPPQPPSPSSPQPVSTVFPAGVSLEFGKRDRHRNVENSMVGITSSSRWPKPEIEALIQIRTSLDLKYQENGPKGPLWEEISREMQKLGYNRNAKRCKEKWENINKYFKKVKESSKKRPEDSKTCPYFHQLDALYKEKSKIINSNQHINSNNEIGSSVNYSSTVIMPITTTNTTTMEPLMVQPEQQWPPPPPPPLTLQQQGGQPESAVIEDIDKRVNIDQNFEEEEDDEDEDDGDTEEDDDDGVGGFEVVANKGASLGTNGE